MIRHNKEHILNKMCLKRNALFPHLKKYPVWRAPSRQEPHLYWNVMWRETPSSDSCRRKACGSPARDRMTQIFRRYLRLAYLHVYNMSWRIACERRVHDKSIHERKQQINKLWITVMCWESNSALVGCSTACFQLCYDITSSLQIDWDSKTRCRTHRLVWEVKVAAGLGFAPLGLRRSLDWDNETTFPVYILEM